MLQCGMSGLVCPYFSSTLVVWSRGRAVALPSCLQQGSFVRVVRCVGENNLRLHCTTWSSQISMDVSSSSNCWDSMVLTAGLLIGAQLSPTPCVMAQTNTMVT